jgi:pilus assembly protein CpaB
MRPKTLILLLLALGCGLVASIGISQVINRNRESAPVETEAILVALKDIKVNELLDDKNLRIEEWPKEKIPADAVRTLKDADHQRAGTKIFAGEPIRKAKFAVDQRQEEIPKGFRVVGVPVDAASAAGNLLQPGDRVDVVFSAKPDGPGGQKQHVAKTILQNIKVFAVNEQWRPAQGDKSDEVITAKTVSLLLTPAQAEVLALANEMGGHIRLALRNNEDEQVAQSGSTDLGGLLQGTFFGQKGTDADTASMIDWIKNLQQPAAPQAPTAVASAAGPQQDQHFTMELFPGTGVSRVDLVRGANEGVWNTAKIDELKKPTEDKLSEEQQNPAGGGASGFVMMQALPAAKK